MTAPTETVELPKLPEPALPAFYGEVFSTKPYYGEEQMTEFARAAVLADRASRSPVVGAVGGEPLTDEQLDRVLGAAYRKLVIDTGYSGGMGSETWDRAAARAIEAAHGIGVSPTGSPEGEVSHE